MKNTGDVVWARIGRATGRGKKRKTSRNYNMYMIAILSRTNRRTKPKITYFVCNKHGIFLTSTLTLEGGATFGSGEQQLMNNIMVLDEYAGNNDDESIILTVQYLKTCQNSSLKSGKLHKSSVLIDTSSTCSLLNDKKMMVNVKVSKTYLEHTLTVGINIPILLENFWSFKVWLHPESMLNILE